jgi:16S rRNA (cytidine1402-2'-O)-methyltransferase
MPDGKGTLYIVPTPIGNLEDITLRALRVLREISTIACEDTRVTGMLLRHYELPQKKLISYFAGNERERIGGLLRILEAGEDIALVSDAGTPGISDPGTRLVSAAIEAGITVDPLPGATALIPAVVASGLPTDSVLFEGFLPHKKGRQTKLQTLALEGRTFVLYESPHRIVKTLGELAEHCGADRPIALFRELTKMHQEINRGPVGEIHALYVARQSIRGEFVLVVGGKEPEKVKRKRWDDDEGEEDGST